MLDTVTTPWQQLIDDVLLSALVAYARGAGDDVRTVYLTGSYVRGSWNQRRPNINVYFIAAPEATARVRAELSAVFADIRRRTREHGVDFVVDCHPFTISHRDTEWLDAPVLTLTTKVFDAAYADDEHRLLVSPTIGYGWWATHRVLHGEPDALKMFARVPGRDESWFRGAHAALCHYRRMLDHLPWAIDVEAHTHHFVEETCRYAEEAIKDGVHFGATDEEVLAAADVEILHHWTSAARQFYSERYGPDGAWAVDAVAALKQAVLQEGHSPEAARAHWQDAVRVWTVVWRGYLRLVEQRALPTELTRVMSWM